MMVLRREQSKPRTYHKLWRNKVYTFFQKIDYTPQGRVRPVAPGPEGGCVRRGQHGCWPSRFYVPCASYMTMAVHCNGMQ